jgi:transcriptional regulator with XRE-family HTH domain
MKIGAALASFIRERGTSAADICRSTGIKPASMSKYISDKTEPGYATLKQIAEAIGINACQIVARAEGVAIEMKYETTAQSKTRLMLESLDERDLYKVAAIAEIIKADTK